MNRGIRRLNIDYDIPVVDPRLADVTDVNWLMSSTVADYHRIEVWAYVGYQPVRRLAGGPAMRTIAMARAFVERNRGQLSAQLVPPEVLRVRMTVSSVVPRTPPRMADVGAPSFRDTPPPAPRRAVNPGVTIEIDEMDEDVADAQAIAIDLTSDE